MYKNCAGARAEEIILTMADRYCNFCGQPIIWDKFNGKWIPMNENGTSHFDTCIPNKSYQEKRDRLMKLKPKLPPLQLSENEFVN